VDRVFDGTFRMIFAASTPVPPGTTLEAWVEEHAPSRQTLDPGGDAWQCRGPGSGTWMHIPYAPWRPWQVGDHEAIERDGCFFIDVVAIVGDRAYLFTTRSSAVIQTPVSTRAHFDEFLETVEFTPQTAIDD
jgi:hypothetical protein